MCLLCSPDDVEHLVFGHPVDKERNIKLLVHVHRIVLDDLVEVTDALDPTFEEFRFEALLAHLQLENL